MPSVEKAIDHDGSCFGSRESVHVYHYGGGSQVVRLPPDQLLSDPDFWVTAQPGPVSAGSHTLHEHVHRRPQIDNATAVSEEVEIHRSVTHARRHPGYERGRQHRGAMQLRGLSGVQRLSAVRGQLDDCSALEGL